MTLTFFFFDVFLLIGHFKSKLKYAPLPGIPRAFDTFAVPERREFDYQSLPGGGEFELHPRVHVKSLAWRAIMRDAVLEDFRGKDCALVSSEISFVPYLRYLKCLILDSGFEYMNVFYCCVYNEIQYLYPGGDSAYERGGDARRKF